VETKGNHETGIIPTINTWYRFIVEVEAVGTGTAVRVKVWEDNTAEPTNWQINTTDTSNPLTSGTFGLWAYSSGSKYWDELAVAPLNSSQPTPTPTNTPEPGNTATPTGTTAVTSTPTATPDPDQPARIQRSTYAITGQAVTLRVIDKDANGVELTNNLYYFHTDHLGSNSAMSDSSGALVAGNTARFTPFGAYRTTPTTDLTDRGFTGHKENRSLGLTYMNARFYVVGLNRFASADTLVPNPANPQSLNRYTYVLNSPLNLLPCFCAKNREIVSYAKQIQDRIEDTICPVVAGEEP
jgi:RHS repeat-associated protein